MISYVRKFELNTTMCFKISDKQLLKKSNQIWKRFEKFSKIKFDGEPVYNDNDKYIKTKTKIYGGSVNTYFHGKKIPKEKAPCKSISIIMLDSVVKLEKKYYPQTLLEECKYEPKKIKTENLDDDLEKGLSDESNSETDNDSNDETQSDDEKDNDESNKFVKS